MPDSREIGEAIGEGMAGPMAALLGPQNILAAAQAADAFLSAAQRVRSMCADTLKDIISASDADLKEELKNHYVRLNVLYEQCINRAERLFSRPQPKPSAE